MKSVGEIEKEIWAAFDAKLITMEEVLVKLRNLKLFLRQRMERV